jgi:hypothetical protein
VVSGVQLLCELGTLLVPLNTLVLKRNKLLLEVSNSLSSKLTVEGEDIPLSPWSPSTQLRAYPEWKDETPVCCTPPPTTSKAGAQQPLEGPS